MTPDESIILNFVSEGPAKLPVRKIKGSVRWTDRLKHRKRDHNRFKAVKTGLAPISVVENGSSVVESQKKENKAPPIDVQAGSRPFISSLFTNNPELAPDEDAKVLDKKEKAASNDVDYSNSGFMTSVVPEWLSRHLEQKFNISRSTTIQQRAIPTLLSSLASESSQKPPVVIQAETGSGKTLCFLIPLLLSLCTIDESKKNRTSGIYAILLSPTREICLQTLSTLNKLINHPKLHWIVPGVVIGGERRKSEKARIRKGINIVVCTPGRLLDHLKTTRNLNLHQVFYYVMDEADRLLDLGFRETLLDIQKMIKSQKKVKPQSILNVLCSATINQEIIEGTAYSQKMISNYSSEQETFENLAPILLKSQHEALNVPPTQLQHSYIQIPAKIRLVALYSILKLAAQKEQRVIVFFSCTDSVDFYFQVFSGQKLLTSENMLQSTDLDIQLARLHGNLNQSQRSQTLFKFRDTCEKSKYACVLLCTDVASRGLDLPFVDLLVQYDVPFSSDDYLHRIGRTARLGRKGTAKLFLMPSEIEYRNYLGFKIEGGVAKDDLTYENYLIKALNDTPRSNSKKTWNDSVTDWQCNVERLIAGNEDYHTLAKKAFLSFIRAYTTHSTKQNPYLSVRNLHLGHIAKTFGLREAPKQVSNVKADAKRKSSFEEQPSKKKSLIMQMNNFAMNDIGNEFVTDYKSYI